jgi:hypothetical protein
MGAEVWGQTPADYGTTGKSRNPGSSPGRTLKMAMESPPLHQLLTSLGRVQHHLHTAIVGLCAVEGGAAQKPDDLDISWKATDLKGSARESRRFLLRSTLVFTAEELAEYALQILRFRGDGFPDDRAERLRALGSVEPAYLAVAPIIVSHWRNRIIHRTSKARLLNSEVDRLVEHRDTIKETFKGLVVSELIEHFETDQPTLKDVTVLLAMSIRFARLADLSLPEPSNAQAVSRWLSVLGLLDVVLQREKEARNGNSPDPRARARQLLLTEAPTLAEVYYSHGAAKLLALDDKN